MLQGFRALLCAGICWIALVAVNVQAATSGVESGVRQARCPLALMQLNASPGLLSASKDHRNTSAVSTTTTTATTTKHASTTSKGEVQKIEDHLKKVTSAISTATTTATTTKNASTTSKGEVRKIEDHVKHITSKAVNASKAAGGIIANAWNAAEDAASDAASWAGNAASAVKHALGNAANAVSNMSEEVVSSIEDSVAGTANSSNSSNSNASEGIVGRLIDGVAGDVNGASQAVADVVGSAWNSSAHHRSKRKSGAKSKPGCVTQATENAQALYSYVSPAGSSCLFGVDERDEGSHCIDQGGEYGPSGWCWTSEDLASWGKCANGCPLSGAEAVLGKKLERIEKKLEKIESEIRAH
eukprot:TRINITY_DN43833_c0_g1_i1.p1 TRINITY_DN43833_c0_g1~~TRINITY_DN43833_c0_g1_i1.p1  ORF type:complete len:357 (+),score=67.09 TRINITY_DN43833_c0_g1_i1:93-1163(+)